jgi:hypothetical protein
MYRITLAAPHKTAPTTGTLIAICAFIVTIVGAILIINPK